MNFYMNDTIGLITQNHSMQVYNIIFFVKRKTNRKSQMTHIELIVLTILVDAIFINVT